MAARGRVARLARERLPGKPLGCQTHGALAGHLRDLSAKLQTERKTEGDRSVQSALRATIPLAARCRIRPGQRIAYLRVADANYRRRKQPDLPTMGLLQGIEFT